MSGAHCDFTVILAIREEYTGHVAAVDSPTICNFPNVTDLFEEAFLQYSGHLLLAMRSFNENSGLILNGKDPRGVVSDTQCSDLPASTGRMVKCLDCTDSTNHDPETLEILPLF